MAVVERVHFGIESVMHILILYNREPERSRVIISTFNAIFIDSTYLKYLGCSLRAQE